MQGSTTQSLERFSEEEVLTGNNSVFCSNCSTNSPSSIFKCLSVSGNFMILSSNRFQNYNSSLFKNIEHLMKSQIKSSLFFFFVMEFISKKPYQLQSFISHSGTFDQGHYVTFLRNKGLWFKCEDTSIVEVEYLEIDWASPYILFYKSVLLTSCG